MSQFPKDESAIVVIRPDRKVLPYDSLPLLHHREMLSRVYQKMASRPPLPFLDTQDNCAANVASIDAIEPQMRLYGLPLDGNRTYLKILVGAPELEVLHLPAAFAPLAALATKAATAAYEMGHLGHCSIIMWLQMAKRPFDTPYWHPDVMPTYLNCSNKSSTVYATSGADFQAAKAVIGPETTYVQPPPGMPVAFNQIIHTRPYQIEGAPPIEAERSCVLAFHAVSRSEAHKLCMEGSISSDAIKKKTWELGEAKWNAGLR